MPKRQNKTELNESDIQASFGSSSSGGRRKARQPRSLDLRSSRVELLHVPSGVKVKGEIPSGHYNRKQMQKLTLELKARLTEELGQLVGKKLRVAGR